MTKIKGPTLGRRTAAAIAAEISALDAEHAPRLADLQAAQTARLALVEAGDVDAIEAVDAKIRRATVEGEVHATRRARLVGEHDAARAAETHAAEQAERQAAYDQASAAAEEAARRLREDYPRLAREIAEILASAWSAQALVIAANKARPEGAPPLRVDFEPNRGRPWTEGHYEQLEKVARYDRRTGEEVYGFTPGDPNIVEQRVPNGRSWVPGQQGSPHVSLREAVQLPGVAFGDAPFWPPRAVAAPSSN